MNIETGKTIRVEKSRSSSQYVKGDNFNQIVCETLVLAIARVDIDSSMC